MSLLPSTCRRSHKSALHLSFGHLLRQQQTEVQPFIVTSRSQVFHTATRELPAYKPPREKRLPAITWLSPREHGLLTAVNGSISHYRYVPNVVRCLRYGNHRHLSSTSFLVKLPTSLPKKMGPSS